MNQHKRKCQRIAASMIKVKSFLYCAFKLTERENKGPVFILHLPGPADIPQTLTSKCRSTKNS